MSSPTEKIKKVKDMIEIYKLMQVVELAGPEFDKLIVDTVVVARVPNLVSTLRYPPDYLATSRPTCRPSG